MVEALGSVAVATLAGQGTVWSSCDQDSELATVDGLVCVAADLGI